jgi:hypothetical protein
MKAIAVKISSTIKTVNGDNIAIIAGGIFIIGLTLFVAINS